MSEKMNLKKKNFSLFLNTLNVVKFDHTTYFKSLPSIPSVYFNNSNSIIDQYHKIKVILEKLKKTKELLLLFLESEKDILQPITISREKNFLFSRNLLIELRNAQKSILKNKYKNYNKSSVKLTDVENKFIKIINKEYPFENDEICTFLKKIKKSKNIISNISSHQFHPAEIFKNEFFKKNKTYYLRLFDEYQKLRNQLFDELNTSNFGIMAFEHFFDLSYIDKVKENSEKLLEKLNLSKSNNSSINYNKYVYINNDGSDNNTNRLLNVRENKKTKLFEKISEYNILYLNVITAPNIKINYKKKITDIYNNLNNNINAYVGNNVKNNLYDVLVSSINTDFSVIEFVATYIDPDLFNTVIDNDFKVKEYIQYKITEFQNYYSLYQEWFNNITKSGSSSKAFNELILFNEFINNINFFEGKKR